ncbi:protein IWS1 homolog [Argiope bruennichi]|uniref:protein IWS1 homolog n=1 Tax=Argiope bruennichi TaxID=94029 RepID=UPI002494E206|nr:protein IWS1 homolog [Argiope bruennichi]
MDRNFSILFENTDDEEEEFQGFTEEDVERATKHARKKYQKFKAITLRYDGEKDRKSVEEEECCRKYHDMEYCKFNNKESKLNQKTKYMCKPTSAEFSENRNKECDEDCLKSWIFRDTDDEDEEFEGFTEEDLDSNEELITKNCLIKERTDEDSRRALENSANMCEKYEMQRFSCCSSSEGRDEDEGMFSDSEFSSEMDVKWYARVMKVLESSIENDENDEKDQRILRQNLNKVFGINKDDDILLKIFVKK